MADVATSSLVTAIPALSVIPALLTVAVSYAKDLSAKARRLREIDEATKHVAFWDSWKKAMDTEITEEEKQRHLNHIRLIGRYVERLRFGMVPSALTIPPPGIGWFRRLFLLFELRDRKAQLVRQTLFAWPLYIGVISTVVIPRIQRPIHSDLWTWHLVETLNVATALIVGFWLTRWSVIRYEKQHIRRVFFEHENRNRDFSSARPPS